MQCVEDQCHASKLQLQYSDNNLLLHQAVCNIVNYLLMVCVISNSSQLPEANTKMLSVLAQTWVCGHCMPPCNHPDDCFSLINTRAIMQRSLKSRMTYCLLLSSCLHAALQQRADGAAADSTLPFLLLCSIPLSISLSSFCPAVLQPSTPVLPHYVAAPSPHSGTDHGSVLLLSRLRHRSLHSEGQGEGKIMWSTDLDVGLFDL